MSRTRVALLLVALTACSSADKQKIACDHGDAAACDALATQYATRARELCEKSDGGASDACAHYPKIVALDLPKLSTGDGTETAVTMSLTVDGKIYGNGELLPTDDAILTFAKNARQKAPEVRAVIMADTNATQGSVIHLMDLLKQAGIAKIAFGVSPLGVHERP